MNWTRYNGPFLDTIDVIRVLNGGIEHGCAIEFDQANILALSYNSNLPEQRLFIRTDYRLKDDLFIPASKNRCRFDTFLPCEAFDIDEDNNFTRLTCTVTNSLFSLYKKKPQEIFKATENAPFLMMT